MVTAEKARQSLLDMLRQRSFERRQVVLSSGKSSNFYIDCKQTTLNGRGHVYVGRCLLQALEAYEADTKQTMVGVGGLTLGADPIASAVSMTAALDGRDLGAFIVRKEAKGHGTAAYLEGVKHLPLGPVAIVEDVMTTGASSLQAVERTRAAGYTVSIVLGLVDRQEGARENLEAAGVHVISLFSKDDFMG
ncbi:MAG: orotate phosphoribosyltransferase [Myxococcota bacterium]